MRALTLVLFLGALQLSGQLQLTRYYPTPPKTSPLHLVNCGRDHFFLLRYNKLAHDITLEKRRKSDGSVAGFLALKMDSVNASWFNYLDLDWMIFEKQGKLYFVFGRVLNNQSTVYMKEIDTASCRSSGFIELATLSGTTKADMLDLDFQLLANKNLLLIKTVGYGGNYTKELVIIDPADRNQLARYRLPVENGEAGFSDQYTFDNELNLYYVLKKFQGIDRLNTVLLGMLRSALLTDSLFLMKFNNKGDLLTKRSLEVSDDIYVHSLKPVADSTGMSLHMMYSGTNENGEDKLYFISWKFNRDLTTQNFSLEPLKEELEKNLTYFDGTEYDVAARKVFNQRSFTSFYPYSWHISERKNENYLKEMLVWRTDDAGRVELQHLLPRKTFFFPERVLFRTMGEVMHAVKGDTLFSIFLEHRNNLSTDPLTYKYQSLARQESLQGANLVVYKSAPGMQAPAKKLLYSNGNISCVPLGYSGNEEDLVLYFVISESECYSVISLNQL